MPFALFAVLLGTSPPNILIAISDDQSFPHASAYGSKMVSTPAFDRVASQGILFSNAFAPSPGCSPCRASFLTGRYPWQIEHAGTHASEFPQKYVTFPDRLEKAGYFVGYTGKGWGPGNWKVSGRSRNPAGPEFIRKRLSDRSKPGGASNNDYAGNFADFLSRRPKDQPFCFWYGCQEPHRIYEKGSGLKAGKTLADAEVPAFLPDTPEIRSDLLDYALEIEWFDRHLGQMLAELEKRGELDNTLVIVTSDNGMPFPRAKANCYEHGIHMPLAVSWPAKIPAGRTVDDLVSFVDLTATILDVAGVEQPTEGPVALAGRSLTALLTDTKSGTLAPARSEVYSARERHSSSRYNNLSYPQRALRTKRYLYIRNFHPERWPAGDPQTLNADGSLGPMHGAYHDIDACPSLTFLVANRDDPAVHQYFRFAVEKRPSEELYDIEKDPSCLENLAGVPSHQETLVDHRNRLTQYLEQTSDPRVTGDGDVFETYKRYSRIRKFPESP